MKKLAMGVVMLLMFAVPMMLLTGCRDNDEMDSIGVPNGTYTLSAVNSGSAIADGMMMGMMAGSNIVINGNQITVNIRITFIGDPIVETGSGTFTFDSETGIMTLSGEAMEAFDEEPGEVRLNANNQIEIVSDGGTMTFTRS